MEGMNWTLMYKNYEPPDDDDDEQDDDEQEPID